MKSLLVAYYRVSSQRQGRSGLGLEAQQAAVREYAIHNGHEVAAEFTEIESGRKSDRPELRAALARAKATSATLCVAKLDRLARNVRFLLELADGGVPLLFLDLPTLPLSDPIIGRLILTMMGAIAEFEARRIGQRVKEALARAKLRGVKLGMAARKVKYVQPREESVRYSAMGRAEIARRTAAFRAAVVPLAKELRSQGKTWRAIAEELTARGIASRFKRPKWTAGMVHALLKTEAGEWTEPI